MAEAVDVWSGSSLAFNSLAVGSKGEEGREKDGEKDMRGGREGREGGEGRRGREEGERGRGGVSRVEGEGRIEEYSNGSGMGDAREKFLKRREGRKRELGGKGEGGGELNFRGFRIRPQSDENGRTFLLVDPSFHVRETSSYSAMPSFTPEPEPHPSLKALLSTLPDETKVCSLQESEE